MSFYSNRVNVFGVAAYPADPQVDPGFEPKKIQFINEDSSDDAFVSFDGTTDHLRLVPGSPITVEQRGFRQAWLKRGVAGSDPTTIQVVVES